MSEARIAQRLRRVLWLAWPIAFLTWLSWLGTVAAGDGLRDGLGHVVGADHLAFYSAAHLVIDGQPKMMYDYSFLAGYQKELLDDRWESLEAYRNPPFYALLYLPTVRLPFSVSMWIWGGIGLGCLAIGIRWLRAARPWNVLAWSLTFYPVLAAVMFGQNSLLSFGIFAAVFRFLDDDRPFLAGLAAGLLFYKPQLLVGVFVWWGLMPRTHVRCWLGLITTGLVLAAVSWIVLPSASWQFVATLRENAAYNSFAQWNVHTPRAFFVQLMPEYPALSLYLGTAFGLCGVGVAAWIVRRTGGPLRVMFPTAVFLSLWSSPHTLIYEWAIAISAAIVMWERVPEKRDIWCVLFAVVWSVLLVSTFLAQFQTEGIGFKTSAVDFHFPLRFARVLQISVPVLGVIGWLIAREFIRLVPVPSRVGINGPVVATNPAADPSRT